MNNSFPKYTLHRVKDRACLSMSQRVTEQMTLKTHAQNFKNMRRELCKYKEFLCVHFIDGGVFINFESDFISRL